MDVRMPGIDGIEATRGLPAVGPGPRVLMLTTFDLDEYDYEVRPHPGRGARYETGLVQPGSGEGR